MEHQSLLQYLSLSLPPIPRIPDISPDLNTPYPSYDSHKITQIIDWPDFNHRTLMQRYSNLLTSKQVASEPFPSPPMGVTDEHHFGSRVAELILPRIRRALRAGFQELAPQLQQLNLVPVTIDGGTTASYVEGDIQPDLAYVQIDPEDGSNYDENEPANRAPGVFQVWWKWRSGDRDALDPATEHEYRRVLSRVNFYMDQYGARHGFVLTNAELVAVKRLDESGCLAVAEAIPWTAGGPGQMTVLMGLWYLGMLAAEERNWFL